MYIVLSSGEGKGLICIKGIHEESFENAKNIKMFFQTKNYFNIIKNVLYFINAFWEYSIL